ncbi:uncharacterized protein J4E84_004425 [Alternaria hordeiaustralica]|uniref:uncharacterized protein n=1 Tax=Alternaria hordeiaustralica TaxID=1187925 RepID=UPI0020C2D459|nr:uncharacterized protein J4E84_004425 [Alternaria hordeiaustralica]KAI4690241.1 hypothetical protein J4E84_004425 [Alternaria hordeiaustralica]
MSAATEDALAEKRPQMPEKYTWLRKADSLQEGCCVSLCVPTSAIDEARSKMAEGDPEDDPEDSVVDAVLKRVVAIKIPGKDSKQPTMHHEARVLDDIRRQAYPRSGGAHCIELLDHYDMDAMDRGEPGWLVMASSSVCCDLDALYNFDIGNKLEKALLWLMIAHVYEAVYFLHRNCDPPITHGDITFEAILVSCPYEKGKNGKSAIAKRPKISLISFSESEMHDPNGSPDDVGRKARAEEEDVENLDSAIQRLVKRCYEGYEQGFVGKGKATYSITKKVWKDDTPEEVKRFMAKDVQGLNGLWADIGKFAKEQLEDVSDEEWEELRDSIIEVTESEGKLSDIVTDLLKGQPVED